MFLKSNFHFKVWPRKLSHAASKSQPLLSYIALYEYMNIIHWITLEVKLMSRLKVQHWQVRLLQIWWPCHVIWCCLLDEHLLPLVYPLLSLPPLSCILYRQCQQGPVLTSAISTLAFILGMYAATDLRLLHIVSRTVFHTTDLSGLVGRGRSSPAGDWHLSYQARPHQFPGCPDYLSRSSKS